MISSAYVYTQDVNCINKVYIWEHFVLIDIVEQF